MRTRVFILESERAKVEGQGTSATRDRIIAKRYNVHKRINTRNSRQAVEVRKVAESTEKERLFC